jgi:CBS-domain-containing membrane protein
MPNEPSRSTPSDNQDTSLLRRICKLLHIPVPDLVIIDPQFRSQPGQFFIQSGLAIIGMFAVLLLVDSFSDAALAAGLGSSVLIIFVHPSSHAATPRSLLGGHILALLIGSVFSLVLFAPPISSFLTSITPLRDLALAASVGVLIIVMAVTDTEHPPAAGTVLGISTRVWDPEIFAIIVGAVLLLAVIKRVLRRYLRDLI